ncbi:hypothetical protein OCU04_009934 [Sclerotinia nivalis]|uniref:Uncharacterized protein n=1 Tax=Sclerotinia nivalis TaxID=352851 RepID=A0A9X0ADP2_9HELO|nr:hypothetical protein OCU04_009934 [Sclerotinia nivalis]
MPETRSTKLKANNKLGGITSSKRVSRKRVSPNPKRVNPKRGKQSNNAADAADIQSRITLLDLPLEVRQMIYRLIIVKQNAIQITSPMDTLPRGHPEKKNRTPPKGGAALLEVSKAMHCDAAQYFYENNNFIIGSPIKHMVHVGRFTKSSRSSIKANRHGLQSFLTRVPRFYVNCIRELTILTPVAILSKSHWCGLWGNPGIAICPGHPVSHHLPKSIIAHFQDMTVAALKRFPGLRIANIIFTDAEDAEDDWRELPHSTVERSLVNSFNILFHHDNLEKITLRLDLKGEAPHYRFCTRHPLEGSHIFHVIEKAMKKAVKGQDGLWTSPETNGDDIDDSKGILLSRYQGEAGEGENADENQSYLWQISRTG